MAGGNATHARELPERPRGEEVGPARAWSVSWPLSWRSSASPSRQPRAARGAGAGRVGTLSALLVGGREGDAGREQRGGLRRRTSDNMCSRGLARQATSHPSVSCGERGLVRTTVHTIAARKQGMVGAHVRF